MVEKYHTAGTVDARKIRNKESVNTNLEYLCPGGINAFTGKKEYKHLIRISLPLGTELSPSNICMTHDVQAELVKPHDLIKPP